MHTGIKKTLLMTAALFGLFIGCMDRSLDVNDPDYPTDGYRIEPQWSSIDTNNLRPMALYRVPFTLGKDRFKSMAVKCSDETILDTAILNKEFPDNRLALYFLGTGVCTLTIDGVHPNERHTTVTQVLRIKNPYRIVGDTLLGLQETGTWELDPAPLPDSTNLDLTVEWRLDGESGSMLSPEEQFMFAIVGPGSYLLQSLIVDTLRGHRTAMDSIDIRVPGYRPTLDSLRVITTTLNPGQLPLVHIFSNDIDSTSLDVFVTSDRPDAWRDTFDLSGPAMYSSILTASKPVIDTGIQTFTVTVSDSSGLVSRPLFGSILVKARPPVVRFIPDTSVRGLLPNLLQTLLVSATADTFVWNVDGEDTVTVINRLTRIFLTDDKKTANVSVFGIDRYGYRGPMASIRIVEETSVYDLGFIHVPGDSAHRSRASWIVKTSRSERVRDNGALFYWDIIRLGINDTISRILQSPVGDTGSTFSLESLNRPDINIDSIDIKVSVVLKDSLGQNHTSPVLIDSTRIRPFRPVVTIQEILPRSDSVAVGQEVTIGFSAHDVNRNGIVDSVFWKISTSQTVTALPVPCDSLALQLNQEGAISVLIWARDNDGEISDTALVSLRVVKNRPVVSEITRSQGTIYPHQACTLSVIAGPGFLGSRVIALLWKVSGTTDTLDTLTHEPSLARTFSSPGVQMVAVMAIDSLGDTSVPYRDSITIDPGRPGVSAVSFDTAGGIWVNDQLEFDVSASDPNGSVLQYRIVIKKQGGSDSLMTQSSSSRIPFIIPIGNEGEYTILAYARDNDSLWSPAYQHPSPLWVRAGRPSVIHDTPAAAWIFDTVSLSFTALDSNGSLADIICEWTDGTNDTITLPPNTAQVTDTVRHCFIVDGVKTVRLSVRDDDGQVTVAEVPFTINRGTPRVQALRDTFVWYDDKGVIRGDTVNFKASASDSNGTIMRYVWILKGALDTNAQAPDTAITATDSLVAGASNIAFWAGHQPAYFKPETTYTGAVYVVDDHNLKSAPDTFHYYVDAPRTVTVSATAKEGLLGDPYLFELLDGTTRSDSLNIVLQGIAPGDTNYLSVKIAMVIDSLTDFSNPTTYFDDTISLSDSPDFKLLKQFTPKQSNPGFFYDSDWRLTYRPPLSDFSPYKQTVMVPRPWLFFHIHVELQTRTGVIMTRVSSTPLKMGYTLSFIE